MTSRDDLRRSYQVIPGAAIRGVLGSQTAPNGVADDGQPARYFHYSELGTVLAETKTDGSVLGAWEPDHFGNYEGRYLLDGSPDMPELGLTGKIWDDAAGAYYFNAGWYDPERVRWLREDLLFNMNHYRFCMSNPINYDDPKGLKEDTGWEAGAVCNKSDRNVYMNYDSANKEFWCILPPGKCIKETNKNQEKELTRILYGHPIGRTMLLRSAPQMTLFVAMITAFRKEVAAACRQAAEE